MSRRPRAGDRSTAPRHEEQRRARDGRSPADDMFTRPAQRIGERSAKGNRAGSRPSGKCRQANHESARTNAGGRRAAPGAHPQRSAPKVMNRPKLSGWEERGKPPGTATRSRPQVAGRCSKPAPADPIGQWCRQCADDPERQLAGEPIAPLPKMNGTWITAARGIQCPLEGSEEMDRPATAAYVNEVPDVVDVKPRPEASCSRRCVVVRSPGRRASERRRPPAARTR